MYANAYPSKTSTRIAKKTNINTKRLMLPLSIELLMYLRAIKKDLFHMLYTLLNVQHIYGFTGLQVPGKVISIHSD